MAAVSRSVDALVIGAGFGGLGAAVTLAEQGASVVLCEALNYPGGCACTFAKHGARFDAGATLLSGLGPGMWFRRILARADVDLTPHLLDRVIEMRTPGRLLHADRDRRSWENQLRELAGALGTRLDAFLTMQRRVADLLWTLLDRPELLPPSPPHDIIGALGTTHLGTGIDLVRWAGKPLIAVLRHFGLEHFEPLRTWLDAMCQITVQTGVEEAEAPVALGAVDFFFRGCAVLPDGVGALADGLVRAIEHHGGDVRMADRVKRLVRVPGGWQAHTRKGVVRAKKVFANVLPGDLRNLAEVNLPTLQMFGAAMIYGRTLAPTLDAAPQHLELVANPSHPLPGGNHVLLSVSEAESPRAPTGERVFTASTHVPPGASIEAVHQQMQETLRLLAPDVLEGEVLRFTASPKTFERFTRRSGGRVGGRPRTAGLLSYLDLLPTPVAPDLWLVGDATGLGQSTLATALSGHRAAHAAFSFR